MAEFLGDLAFMFEIFVLGMGLVVLHFGKKENAKLLRASGWIMSVVATLGLVCTGYFYMKYYFAGGFDKPYAQHHMMNPSMMKNMMKGGMGNMMGGQGMMQNMQQCMGQMQGKMMDPSMMKKMQGCMMHGMENMGSDQKEMSKEEHESHHE